MSNYEESRLQTVTVPQLGTTDAATLYRAARSPLRVLVRNTGGSLILLSHEAGSLQALGSGGTYGLPAGQSDVFVLMPQQSLLAASVGAVGQASVAVSMAIPFKE